MGEREWVVDPAEAGTRLDRWLAAPSRLGSRAKASTALARGQLFAGERELSPDEAGRPVAAGERVRWWASRPGSASRRAAHRREGLDVVFEDESLIVVDKPAGLLTVPLPADPGALSVKALLSLGSGRRATVHVVHRIDRDTSGLVAFAKTRAALHALREQFAGRTPTRVYLAVVEGRPEPARGTWRDWLWWNADRLRQEPSRQAAAGALEAVTHYRVRDQSESAATVEITLETGRQHQVRVQAWLNGHPLVGERRYRSGPAAWGEDFPRQALHAWRLGLRHPQDDRPLSFEAPVPADLARLIREVKRAARPGSRSARGTTAT
jgi:23S rRNA pseudouridine1911/1915/1917 synthase